MFKKTKSYLQFENQFCGIEHGIKNGQETLKATLLKKTKQQLDIVSVFDATTIKELANELPKKKQATLVINNHNVLFKTIELNQGNNIKVVYQAFPNVNIDDFYYEVFQQNNIFFVALCRKDYVNTIIETYKTHHVFVTKISLGHNLISNVLEFISQPTILISNAVISVVNNTITSVKKHEESHPVFYNVNGLKTSNQELMSLCAALHSVLKINTTQNNFDTQTELLLTDYKQSHFFNQGLKLSGISILGILLINFLFFNHYFQALKTLETSSTINQSTKVQVATLSKSVNKTQNLVDDILKSTASKASYYTNIIIQSIPSSILLSELDYQPLKKTIRKNQPIQLEKEVLLISGESNLSDNFSKWINDLELLNWVKKVEIMDYSDLSSFNSKFIIKINLNREE